MGQINRNLLFSLLVLIISTKTCLATIYWPHASSQFHTLLGERGSNKTSGTLGSDLTLLYGIKNTFFENSDFELEIFFLTGEVAFEEGDNIPLSDAKETLYHYGVNSWLKSGVKSRIGLTIGSLSELYFETDTTTSMTDVKSKNIQYYGLIIEQFLLGTLQSGLGIRLQYEPSMSSDVLRSRERFKLSGLFSIRSNSTSLEVHGNYARSSKTVNDLQFKHTEVGVNFLIGFNY